MRLSLIEIELLKLVGSVHPAFSSVAKLVKTLGRARNEVVEVLDGLGRLQFLKLTNKNEVYLLKEGKEYLGINNHAVKSHLPILDADIKADIKASDSLIEPSKTSLHVVKDKKPTSWNVNNIDSQLKELKQNLTKEEYSVEEVNLKIEVLLKVSELLSDDLRALLIDIANDLQAFSDETDTPDEAA